jgi:hypothetical protein
MIHAISVHDIEAISFCTRVSVSSPMIEIEINPIDCCVPVRGIISLFTDGISTFFLVTSTVNIFLDTSFSDARKIVRTTVVSLGQRILLTISASSRSATFDQLTSTIISSGRSPAIAAGVPLYTSWIIAPSFFFCKAAPIHSKLSSPFNAHLNDVFFSTGKYSVYGSFIASTNHWILPSRIPLNEILSLS